MYYKRSRSSVRGQGHSVKTSFDRQIIVLFYQLGVAVSNDDIESLIKGSEHAVSAHAQNKIGHAEHPRTNGATSGDPVFKLQCIRNCHLF